MALGHHEIPDIKASDSLACPDDECTVQLDERGKSAQIAEDTYVDVLAALSN